MRDDYAELLLSSSKIKDLEEILEEVIEVESEPCRYDHHGYCQSHWMHEYPCPIEKAKQMIGGYE